MAPKNRLSEKLLAALKDLDAWAGRHQIELEMLEMDEAIRFVRETNTPPQPRFYPDFEEMVGRLRELAK